MKVKEVEIEKIFRIDNTFSRPKLKIKKGYVDIASQYVWICREEVNAEILTNKQIETIIKNWKLTPEQFGKHKQMLIKKYIRRIK